MRLKGKVALVTGAGSGIGKAIAMRFAMEGAHVIVNYRPNGRHNGEEVRAELAEHDPTAMAIAANVTDREQVGKMIREIVDRFDRLDVVVNNAGVQSRKPFLDITDDDWNKVLSVNLYGSFLVSQEAVRQMVRQSDGGRLIFVSSVHEDIPFLNYTPYCASKGGIRMLMRNLAYELAEHKINVNNIAPGAITTIANEAVMEDPDAQKAALTEIPAGRFGGADEVASVAVFLASDESAYVTGSTYYIDGGMAGRGTRH